jgi:hypothetical protein
MGDDGDASWAAIKDELLALIQTRPKRSRLRAPFRLSHWEYTDAQGLQAQATARLIYLDVLTENEPRVLEELIEAPFRALEATWQDTGRDAPPHERFPELGDDIQWDIMARLLGASQERSDGGVLAALDRWSQRWGPRKVDPSLSPMDDWFVSSGLYTLVIWVISPIIRSAARLLYVPGPLKFDHSMAVMQPHQRTISIELPWFPGIESLQEAEDRLMTECRRRIQLELAAVEAEAEQHGMVRAPVKRTGDEHFAWLVRFQVQGESYAEIARSVCKERQTVAEAIRKTAALVDLPLRSPDRTGPRHTPKPPRVVRVERP